MPSCLGLYVESNFIKYAKLNKDNNTVKIDSFGIKFFDNLDETIRQIIAETYSFKTPISINLSEEQYNYLHLFSSLSKKDLENVINMEFESICTDNGVNKDGFETRYVLVNQLEDKEKIKVIHISAPKTELERKNKLLEENEIENISPISMTIPNLLEDAKKENSIIVNIEDKTTLTTVIDNSIYDVTTVDLGMADIFNKINAKENSYSKAYEICKNTTIYTDEGKDLQYEENEYLEDIMPILYDIVGQVLKITNEMLTTIDKVYITGTGSVINNIDLYFQEYLKEIKCEILKPYFINTNNAKVNIKDYVEVNSATALALKGMGQGIKAINFKKPSGKEKLLNLLLSDVNFSNKTNGSSNGFDLDKALLKLKRPTQLLNIALIVVIIMYSTISITLGKLIDNKEKETQTSIQNIQDGINEKASEYETIIANINEKTTISERNKKLKQAIPTLMNNIMTIIPTGVQVYSIEAVTDTHIVINARAYNYEQLGFLKVKLGQINSRTGDPILYNVVSDSGQRVTETINGQNKNFVKVVIEGDLLPE